MICAANSDGIRDAHELEHLGFERGTPRAIVSDNSTQLNPLRVLTLGHRSCRPAPLRARQAGATRLHRKLQQLSARRKTQRVRSLRARRTREPIRARRHGHLQFSWRRTTVLAFPSWACLHVKGQQHQQPAQTRKTRATLSVLTAN